MNYSVRHVTRFVYEQPITESVMEARMQPRTDTVQRCVSFVLSTMPASRVMRYQDQDGNTVHHFDIPGRHASLTLTSEAVVDCLPAAALPDALGAGAWAQLDALTASGDHWDALAPSEFARPTPLLNELARAVGLERRSDPLATLCWLTREIFERFDYVPRSTRVDSPIDDALRERRGVCQDFSHILIALGRQIGVPCRYVSGYLFQQPGAADRSSDGATHAWIEALMPELGWTAFDPTNNLIGADRHIRVAIGRDYADVPPTRGVFKGVSAVRSELAVAVSVASAPSSATGDVLSFVPWVSRDAAEPAVEDASSQQQ